MHLRPVTPAELENIESTRRAYREMWAKLHHVPARMFDGGREDINTLDFIDYEAGHHPEGDAGAAIIWGGVLVATGLFTWAIGDEQHYVLISDESLGQVLIFPYARLAEAQNSNYFGKGERFTWLLEKTVAEILAMRGYVDHRKALDALLNRSDAGFVQAMQRWLNLRYPVPRR